MRAGSGRTGDSILQFDDQVLALQGINTEYLTEPSRIGRSFVRSEYGRLLYKGN